MVYIGFDTLWFQASIYWAFGNLSCGERGDDCTLCGKKNAIVTVIKQ